MTWSELLDELSRINVKIISVLQYLMHHRLNNELDVRYIRVTFEHVDCSLHGALHR